MNLGCQIINNFYNIGDILDKHALSEETAVEFVRTNINHEFSKHIKSDYSYPKYYLIHHRESINNRFRQNKPNSQDLTVAAMIAAHVTKSPLILYCGISNYEYELMLENAKNMNYVDLLEKSFLKASLVKGYEDDGNYHLRIYVPRGAQAIYLGDTSSSQNNYEFYLQHGAKLHITSIDKEYINCRLINPERIT